MDAIIIGDFHLIKSIFTDKEWYLIHGDREIKIEILKTGLCLSDAVPDQVRKFLEKYLLQKAGLDSGLASDHIVFRPSNSGESREQYIESLQPYRPAEERIKRSTQYEARILERESK